MSAPIRRARASPFRCSSGPRSRPAPMTSRWSTSGSPACSPTPGTIGAYRGAGRPECLLDLERLMDTAARQIGIDPAELRRRNFVTPAQMPYTTAMGETVRYRRFQPVPHQDAGGRRLERLRRRARPRPRSAASSTAAGSPPTSNGPAPWS